MTSLLALACSRQAKTPGEAAHRLSHAVRAGDGKALFAAVDQQTRWSWMTVKRCHRETYDIILSNYPEGPARERELRRYASGATSATAADFFAAEAGPAALASLAPLSAGPDATVEIAADGKTADAVAASGARWPLARGDDGSWGYAGLAADAEERARRAVQDLELARSSAADYERAAARAGAR